MTMNLNEAASFHIKGHRDGLVITLHEADWPTMLEDLLQHMRDRKAFFKGARIAIDAGDHALTISEISALRKQLSEMEVTLWAIQTSDERTVQSSRDLGLETIIPMVKSEKKIKPIDTLISGEEAIFIHKTLRSGFRVVYEGHVIVMGDVNPGAEIIAGGSVIIWGKLRGSIHAGAEGDDTAVICAMAMKPTQARIASFNADVPQAKRGKQQPEVYSVHNGKIIVEPWKS
jgi:septum site-determining protein MinC